MPVDVKDKLRAVVRDLGSQTRVAELLGVSRSRVSRWLRTGEEPDQENRRKLQGVEFVLARLFEEFPREVALDWLLGFNAQLGDRQPMYLLKRGRITEVLGALDADAAGGYA